MKKEKIIAKDNNEISKQLKWMRMFSSSSRNLGHGYDSEAKRGKLAISYEEDHPKIRESGLSLLEPEKPLQQKNDNRIREPKIAFKIDPKTVQKLAQWDQMKSERDFYYSKLKDIDHVLDVYKDASVDTLIQTIKEVLYLPPEKIAMVTDSGNVVIKGAEDDDFNQKENINANFLGDDDADLDFDFEGGTMNLLNDKLEL